MAKPKKDSNPRLIMPPEIEARRAEIHATPSPCYDGQWKIHPAHQYEVIVASWLGGGRAFRTCPGVTEGNTLPERHARAARARVNKA